MANAIDKAVRAQGGAVVKPHQVKAMILAARRAYLEQAKLGLVDDGIGFDAWRRATLHDVVGAAAPSSFRAVTQRDYARVMQYFGELAGNVIRDSDFVIREDPRDPRTTNHEPPTTNHEPPTTNHEPPTTNHDERRRALWSLNLIEGEIAEAFGGRGGARKYADSLFWGIHKTDRYTATARQVWAVIFTLRNRAAKKRAKTALGARGTSDVPLSPPDGSKRFPAFSRAL